MVFFDGFLSLLTFGLWIFCIIDVITTPNDMARNLPKLAWLVIVVLLPPVGPIAWLVAGRPWNPEVRAAAARAGETARENWAARGGARGTTPSRGRAPARPMNPDDDEEFLASLRLRAEEQRRRAREQGEQPPTE